MGPVPPALKQGRERDNRESENPQAGQQVKAGAVWVGAVELDDLARVQGVGVAGGVQRRGMGDPRAGDFWSCSVRVHGRT